MLKTEKPGGSSVCVFITNIKVRGGGGLEGVIGREKKDICNTFQ